MTLRQKARNARTRHQHVVEWVDANMYDTDRVGGCTYIGRDCGDFDTDWQLDDIDAFNAWFDKFCAQDFDIYR